MFVLLLPSPYLALDFFIQMLFLAILSNCLLHLTKLDKLVTIIITIIIIAIMIVLIIITTTLITVIITIIIIMIIMIIIRRVSATRRSSADRNRMVKNISLKIILHAS